MTKRISSLTTQFRSYDEGLTGWIKSFLPSLDDGKDIPLVIAPPDRAFAAMSRLLGSTDYNNIKAIPLPFVSVAPGRLTLDPGRYHGPARIRLGRTDDWGESYMIPHPLPYDINYRIEYWSKNIESMNAIRLLQGLAFTQGYEAFIPINMSQVWPAWGRRLVPVENDTSIMNLEVDADGEGHRIVRSILSCTLKAWLVPDVVRTKNVHRIITDCYLAHTRADMNTPGDEVDDNPDFTNVDTTTID